MLKVLLAGVHDIPCDCNGTGIAWLSLRHLDIVTQVPMRSPIGTTPGSVLILGCRFRMLFDWFGFQLREAMAMRVISLNGRQKQAEQSSNHGDDHQPLNGAKVKPSSRRFNLSVDCVIDCLGCIVRVTVQARPL